MNLDAQRLRESYKHEFSELPPKRVFGQLLLTVVAILVAGLALSSPELVDGALIAIGTFNAAFGFAVTTDWKMESIFYWFGWLLVAAAGFLALFHQPFFMIYLAAMLIIITVTAFKVYKESI